MEAVRCLPVAFLTSRRTGPRNTPLATKSVAAAEVLEAAAEGRPLRVRRRQGPWGIPRRRTSQSWRERSRRGAGEGNT